MPDRRPWPTPTSAIPLAADARLSDTRYTDDQVWELRARAPGEGESASALVVSTRYGGRVGMASIVPLWVVDQQVIYAAASYAQPPQIIEFAPGFIRVGASITPTLELEARYFAFDSQTIGAHFTLINHDAAPAAVRLDLVGFAAAHNRELKSAVVPVGSEGYGLRPCLLPGLEPIILMRGDDSLGSMVDDSAHKIGLTVTIGARARTSIRWVHAGMSRTSDSLRAAYNRLHSSWKDHDGAVRRAAAALPQIATGDAAFDAAIAASCHSLISAYLRPTDHLPHASPVSARRIDTGFSRRGDGSDYGESWAGQHPVTSYLTALGTASAAPALAQGIIRNYLAVQRADGWIDSQPGLAGQRSGALCPPILARLTWAIFQYTEDDQFLREAYPGLLRFLRRWFAADMDADGDGLPEWTTPAQAGYPFSPLFSPAAGDFAADIRLVEAPDLAALLLSEAISLHEISYYLREPADPWLKETINRLEGALEALWRPDLGCYTYRDRDSHLVPSRVILFEDAPGDDDQFIALDLTPPSRIVLVVRGGWERTPSVTVTISGVDMAGRAVREVIEAAQFRWQTARGSAVSRTVFSRVDTVTTAGLIHVYRVSAATTDLTGSELAALLPLYVPHLNPARVQPLIERLFGPAFWHDGGVSMSGNEGENGSNPPLTSHFWMTLLGEGLIEAGHVAEAAQIARRALAAAARSLTIDGQFYEYYHADGGGHTGERGHISGTAPIHLLLRVFGVRIIDAQRVWVGGAFAWDHPVIVRQHGVTVERSAHGSRIAFPSGRIVQLPADVPMQEIVDRQPGGIREQS
ncbi:MAG: MGH1-like glycoside hydrolase domain-containing protein [Candidatus Flexifilum sp.]